ncbi:uncharacterized protein [Dendrobates tinctorius]|uniref:uncharacterized protein n=1 Tax=Dendrobates tinctorius TaxID=92724 RepID=UPI003CCA05FE
MDLQMNSLYRNMDLDLGLSLAFAVACDEERKRQRWRRWRWRYWRHPIVELQESFGAYHSLFNELNDNPDKYYDYTRMSQDSFRYLLRRIEGSISRQDIQLRRAIPAEERLFLATGKTLTSLHFQFFGRNFYPYPPWNYGRPKLQNSSNFVIFPTVLEPWMGNISILPNRQELDLSTSIIKNIFQQCSWRLPVRTAALSPWTSELSDVLMIPVHLKTPTWANAYSVIISISHSHDLFPTLKDLQCRLLLGMWRFVAFQMCGNLLKPYSSRDLDHTKRILNYRLTRAQRTVEWAFWGQQLILKLRQLMRWSRRVWFSIIILWLKSDPTLN